MRLPRPVLLTLLLLVAAAPAAGQVMMRPSASLAARGSGGAGPSLLPLPPLRDVADAAGQEWFVSTRGFRQASGDPKPCGYRVFVRENGCLRGSTLGEMTASLRPEVPTLVFVHGSYVGWDWFRKESRVTTAWVRGARPNCPLQVVYFDWPSDDETCLVAPAVRRLENQAEFNAFVLADVCSRLPVDGRRGGRLTLMGHSHGAMLITAAAHLLGGGVIEGRCSRARVAWKPRLVLAAAALDRDWLSPAVRANRFMPRLRFTGAGRYERAVHVCNRIVILKSHWDAALVAYPVRRLLAKRPLGRTGLKWCDARKLGPLASVVCEVDVTPILGFRHVWPYYVQSDAIARAVAPTIFGR